MLEGTAALAKFRGSPKPEWNLRALDASQRAMALADPKSASEWEAWTDAAVSTASVLHDLARYAEAEPLLRDCQRLRESKTGPNSPGVAVVLNNLAELLRATNRLAEAEPLMARAVRIYSRFQRLTDHEHPNLRVAMRNYRGFLTAQKLAEPEIAARIKSASEGTEKPAPIVPEVVRLLGPAKPVADVLSSLDRQYKEQGKPTVYFLGPKEPIAPHLDELLGKPSK
jgi:Tetratricopeptide repeat